MSDAAEMMLSGLLCETCGEMFDDCEAPGHPRRCDLCEPEPSAEAKAFTAVIMKAIGKMDPRYAPGGEFHRDTPQREDSDHE